ncbi:hypothetical protein FKX85_20250 [Echinicola soli]|uniref:MobA/VirD2-like nuclease domain-containing protein n=1 Tax=Echinicola soli TaxID=2591634 RepID=A0A514CNE3_9BACT|nr:relaxase/mobilization nuclease domain-containing protein [Echinicola soli]QDH81234.1 hypothetical protein FKX85_20250 [Echinicola soli]
MMAIINVGRNINDILYYHFKKINHGIAQLITIHGFGSIGKNMGQKKLNQHFRSFTFRNKRVKVNAIHIFLHFSQKDQLEKSQLRYIAQQYMKRIGYGKQPYLVFNHIDSYCPHLHILSTTITKEGKRLQTHHLGKTLSEKARNELIGELGLHYSPSANGQLPNSPYLEKLEYGKMETIGAIEGIIKGVLRQYTFGSIAEFSAILREFNVGLVQGKKGGVMWRYRGLAYCPLDDRGKHKGGPIKASILSPCPIYKNLLKYIKKNGPGLPGKVAKAQGRFLGIQNEIGKNELEDLDRILHKNGFAINAQMDRESERKRAIGIDHLNRTTFPFSKKLLWSLPRTVVAKLEERYSLVQRGAGERKNKNLISGMVVSTYREGELEKVPVWKLEETPMLLDIFERANRLWAIQPKGSLPLQRAKKAKLSPNRS